MIVESENPQIVAAVQRIAQTITANGGVVAEDFVVRETNGHFDCAVASQPGVPDRVLVSYSPELTVPMSNLDWSSDPDVLEPVAGVDSLDEVQRTLLDEWLSIINSTSKVADIRQSLPRFAVTHWGLRHHLAEAGFPHLRETHQPDTAKDIMINWHCGSIGPSASQTDATGDADGQPEESDRSSVPVSRRFLIPLKHFVNHDPTGASQIPLPGRTAVVTSTSSDSSGTYENYGDLDALQLLVNFGYVDSAAPLVHSVPVEVDTKSWGRVLVEWRGTRAGDKVPDVPQVVRTDDGLSIHHLTARPGNRARIATLLGMIGQSGFGMDAASARDEAEDLIDGIAAANVAYYDRLDRLVLEAQRGLPGGSGAPPGILADLAAVSLLQRERLLRMWG